jgi:hypothetical protein
MAGPVDVWKTLRAKPSSKIENPSSRALLGFSRRAAAKHHLAELR